MTGADTTVNAALVIVPLIVIDASRGMPC